MQLPPIAPNCWSMRRLGSDDKTVSGVRRRVTIPDQERSKAQRVARVLDAKFGERVDDGVDHRAERGTSSG
jgi:hypothetical protein